VSQSITIRQATVADIADLVRLRRLMFEWMGCDDAAQLDASDQAVVAYFAETLPAGKFCGWLAVTSAGEAVGSGAVVDRHPPGPGNPSGRIGYIMNISVEPAYRRRGIARRMMHTALDWLAEQDVHYITLHATEMGRSLYEELGFVASNEMKLKLEKRAE
jgi:ribosomal protein S18 acetylase RimI-like enzyme